jgi:hypothetical protein
VDPERSFYNTQGKKTHTHTQKGIAIILPCLHRAVVAAVVVEEEDGEVVAVEAHPHREDPINNYWNR